MASLLSDFLTSLGTLEDYIAGAADRVPKNPLINPPQTGEWIIVSESKHVIVIYKDGNKLRQISDFSTGGTFKGVDHPTPKGQFTVDFKDKDHTSSLYTDKHGNPAPMSYFVRFAPAVGFHVGNPGAASHGCIHLIEADAKYIFDFAKTSKTRVWVLSSQKKKRDDE
jgi:lipoprotein-anchoring transpeptidase ErfK/SrfK